MKNDISESTTEEICYTASTEVWNLRMQKVLKLLKSWEQSQRACVPCRLHMACRAQHNTCVSENSSNSEVKKRAWSMFLVITTVLELQKCCSLLLQFTGHLKTVVFSWQLRKAVVSEFSISTAMTRFVFKPTTYSPYH